MKKLIYLIIAAFLFVACGTSRKVERQKVSFDSVAVNMSANVERQTTIDTSRNEYVKVTITEIEFSAPDTMPQQIAPENPRASPTNPTITMPYIKHIKQSVFETGVEQSGKSEDNQKQMQCKSNANVSKETKVEQQTPTADNKHNWRWYLAIVSLIIASLLYIKRIPVLNVVKKILAWIRRAV